MTTPSFFIDLIQKVKTKLTLRGFICSNVYGGHSNSNGTKAYILQFDLHSLASPFSVEFYVEHEEYISSLGEFRLLSFEVEGTKPLLKVSTLNLEAIEETKLLDIFCDKVECFISP